LDGRRAWKNGLKFVALHFILCVGANYCYSPENGGEKYVILKEMKRTLEDNPLPGAREDLLRDM
jgi:hypothetical protein